VASICARPPRGSGAHRDSFPIRRAALESQVPYFTTMAGAEAAADGIEFLQRESLRPRSLQEYHEQQPAESPRGSG
jgi:carbamoyl-phosphate synthase large subunit